MAYLRMAGRKKRALQTEFTKLNRYTELDHLGRAAHPAFPAKTANGDTPRMLADEDVHGGVVKYLYARRFDTMRVQWVGLTNKSDLEVFNHAVADNRVLLTQDRGYIRRARDPGTRYDFTSSPGVIVLPSPIDDHVPRSPESFVGMRITLEKFSLNPDLARGKVCEFTPNGRMITHSPQRPCVASNDAPLLTAKR